MKKWIFIILGVLILLYFGARILIDVTSHRPANLGVENGLLAACPESPNCVSTQAKPDDEDHYMEPIPYTGSMEEAHRKMKEAIEQMRGSEVIQMEDDYIYAEYTTAVWHFVDDVEVFIDEEEKLIHLRSASRLGYSDMGKNRTRLDKLVATFNALN